MSIIQIIVIFIVCGLGSFLLYGIWMLENDRDEFRKKYGYDPKYHEWEVKEDDINKDQ